MRLCKHRGEVVMSEKGVFEPYRLFVTADRILEEIDHVNAIIVEAIWKHGPRNLSELGRATKIARSTLTYRIERLLSLGLKIVPVIHLPYISYEVVIAKIKPREGKLLALYERLADHPLLRFIAISIAPHREIYVRLYNKVGTSEALDLLTKLRDEGLIENMYFEVCGDDVLTMNVASEYFSREESRYVYDWKGWISEIETSPTVEEVVIDEVRAYEELDDTDRIVLKMITENPMIDYVDMGAALGVNYQTLRYHYLKHVQRSLLGWNSFVLPVRSYESYVARVEIVFPSTAKMNMFLNTMHKTPLIMEVAKVKGKPAIFTGQIFPIGEAENFLWFYEGLQARGIIEKYDLALLIPNSAKVKPAPPL